MSQRTFANQAEFQRYGRKSRRELFLDEMERVVPWTALLAFVDRTMRSQAMAVVRWDWRSC